MIQVVQNVRKGTTGVRELPDPIALPGHVVVSTVCSVVSAGTERYVVDLARKSLLGKARERPDHVRRVVQKIKQEGLLPTMTQVFAKLDEPMPLGYSSSGVVIECGHGVQEFKPGDRVALAGPHAGVVSIGRNLCAPMPEGVTFEQAAYTSIAAIGLEGMRLARVTLGERVLVIGLGLIGQICVCLLKAQGCRVFGTDIDPRKLELATALGTDAVGIGSPSEAVKAFSDSYGVDAVVITAATASNGPIEFAAESCRTKGRIVLVGVAGLNLPRDPFFKKELEFTVSSSLGPGRGDPAYEEKGIDYPIGHARWTARRNMQAVLETMAAGKLPVEKLTTHHFPIERAPEAYELITSRREPFLGIVIDYPQGTARPRRRVSLRTEAAAGAGTLGVSMIGAGNFARLIMFPILSKLGAVEWRGLCTAKGMNAEHSGRNMGFAFATTDAAEVWNDESTQAVFVATRHDLHAELVIAALRAGKHVFVEKPLCIKPEELHAIASCVEELGTRCPVLMVGFNRRFAPALTQLRGHFTGARPLSISYRFAPGALPADSWPQDEEVGGGRIVGEACHAIDSCVALADSPPVRVFAESVASVNGLETTDDRVFITLRHEDGSISNVSYQAGGDRAAPVERITVDGGGRTGFVDSWDAIELWAGSKMTRSRGGKEKGHETEFKQFVQVCRHGGTWPISWEHIYGTTWASLAAVRSLREGLPVERDSAQD
jgi:predicted dehydrogenase/threonine dehydrogenase-like Zn-dependent dehydrogenase